jgi:hypothetical protein
MEQQTQSEAQAGRGTGRLAMNATTRHTQWLEGVTGTARFMVAENPYITLRVHDGDVDIVPNDVATDVVYRCRSKQDAQALLRGEINPVVAALQGRLDFGGDFGLATRILYGFHGGGYPFISMSEV